MAPPLMVGAAMMSLAAQEGFMRVHPAAKLEALGEGGVKLTDGQLPPNYCTFNFNNASFNLVPLKLDVGQFWLVLAARAASGGGGAPPPAGVAS